MEVTISLEPQRTPDFDPLGVETAKMDLFCLLLHLTYDVVVVQEEEEERMDIC